VEWASGCIDRYQNYFLIKTEDGRSCEIRQMDSSGGVEASFPLLGDTTPAVRPSEDHLVLFSPEKKGFYLVDFKEVELTDVELPALETRKDSLYWLHFFPRASIICLAEKNKARGSVRLSFFNFAAGEKTPITEAGSFETEEGTWKGEWLHEVTTYGKVGWCGSFKN
jgi:hypothetical protein